MIVLDTHVRCSSNRSTSASKVRRSSGAFRLETVGHWHGDCLGSDNTFSDGGYWHFVNNNRSFQKFGAYIGAVSLPLTGGALPLQVYVGPMTLNAFEVLGVLPERGRLPTPEEDAPGGPYVALLSHELWVSQYGGDSSILGETIDLNGTRREVIGDTRCAGTAMILSTLRSSATPP